MDIFRTIYRSLVIFYMFHIRSIEPCMFEMSRARVTPEKTPIRARVPDCTRRGKLGTKRIFYRRKCTQQCAELVMRFEEHPMLPTLATFGS